MGGAAVASVARDYRDMVIETLADSEAFLRGRVVELEADVRAYRGLAIAGFDALRSLTLRHDCLCEEHRQLRDEYRWLREELLLRVGADEDPQAAP